MCSSAGHYPLTERQHEQRRRWFLVVDKAGRSHQSAYQHPLPSGNEEYESHSLATYKYYSRRLTHTYFGTFFFAAWSFCRSVEKWTRYIKKVLSQCSVDSKASEGQVVFHGWNTRGANFPIWSLSACRYPDTCCRQRVAVEFPLGYIA